MRYEQLSQCLDPALISAAPHYGLRYGCAPATGNFQRLRGRPPLVSPLKSCMGRSFTAVTRVRIPPGTPILFKNVGSKLEPYWQDEDDWLCTVEFLPSNDPEGRVFAADIVRYLFGYAQLTNARALALVGDPEAGAYELLFSFSTPGDKDQFLDLVRSNEDMGSDYIENDFMSPTTEEIRNARPLVAVLPEDIVSRATLIASVLCAGDNVELFQRNDQIPE
jgi:hypothetical protein